MPSPGTTARRMVRVTSTQDGSVACLAAVVAPVQRLLDGVGGLLVLAHEVNDATRLHENVSRQLAGHLEYRDTGYGTSRCVRNRPRRYSHAISDTTAGSEWESVGEVDLPGALGADRVHDLGEYVGRDRRVDRHRDQGVPALAVPADLHAGDVDPGPAEETADRADHAGAVLVAEHGHVVVKPDLDVEPVDLDELLDVARA